MKMLWYGSDDVQLYWRLRNAQQTWRHEHPDGEIVRIDAGEQPVERVIATLLAANLFTRDRLVIVRGCFTSSAVFQTIRGYLDRVPATTAVILLSLPGDSSLPAASVTRLCQQLPPDVTAEQLSVKTKATADQLLQHLLSFFTVELESAARVELLNRVQGSESPYTALAEALGRLQLLRRTVTAADVKRYVETAAGTTYAILAAILQHDRPKLAAILAVHDTMEDALRIIGLMTFNLQQLALVAWGDTSLGQWQVSRARALLVKAGNERQQQALVRRLVNQLLALDQRLRSCPNDVTRDIFVYSMLEMAS